MPEVEAPAGSMTWIAIAAVVVGALVRSLKADAMSSLLTRVFRPEGPPVVIPTRALPWIAFVLGGGLAFLEGLREGASREAAAQAGVIAAAGAVFGHELLSGVPGVKKVLCVALLILPLSTTSCHLLTKQNAKTALDAAANACIFSSVLTDAEEVADACSVARELIPLIKNLIGQREAARRAGVTWPGTDAGVPVNAGVDGAQ